MLLRASTENDNQQLVALANVTPMDGAISICIQRQPDFFSVLKRKGSAYTIVAEENKSIIGCVSIIKEERILFGEPTVIHYVCDLKVHPDHRNKKVGTHLSKAMHEYLKTQNADLIFSTVADGNNKVLPIFHEKSGLQNVTAVGKFYIMQVLAGAASAIPSAYSITQCFEEEKIIALYKNFSTKYCLHAGFVPGRFSNSMHFTASKQNETCGAISFADHHDLKQNVIVHLPWYYQVTLPVLRAAKNIINTPDIPRRGEAIKTLYVKSFCYSEGNENAFIALVDYARQFAYQHNYSFISIALNEKDELRKSLKRFISFPYKAYAMMCSLKNNTNLITRIKEGHVSEDFSLI